jgi:molecular chaperone GrpE
MKDQWVRTAADFDNYRKRARREVEDARKAGREELLKDLLPTFDNVERAIQSAQRATEVKPVAEGLSMVVKQFVDVLSRAGITKVPTVGRSFDPSLHEAIQQVETDDHPPGTVVSEIQAGYMQGERLVRAAMVVVAKPRSGETAAS